MPVSYKMDSSAWTGKNVGKALMETIHCYIESKLKDMLQLF
jgi:hypothetical protein